MRIDTIATDMDGTLLGPGGVLTDYTIRVMEECKRRGIKLIPCSGRTHPSMRPYIEKLNTGLPYIGGNGSEIVAPDHTLIEQLTFDIALAKEIITCLKQEGFYVHVYNDEGFYYEEECTASNNYKKSSGMKGTAVGDLCDYLDYPTPKILSVNDPSEVERFLPIIRKKFEGRAIFAVSEPYFLEAEPMGATKGEALARLAAMRGDIVPERTIAFGDGMNDWSLLAYTPNSVAMENARDELKQFARYICRPNSEDGLAHFIEEHVLNTEEGER